MATGAGGQGGIHTEGVNATPSTGTFYNQGSADSAVGEHGLQLAEHKAPVYTKIGACSLAIQFLPQPFRNGYLLVLRLCPTIF